MRFLQDLVKNQKAHISGLFEDLRQRIDQKENEMMILVDEEALKSQTDLDRYLRAIKTQ